ncbi:MAG TPA: flagellar export protein FliJ [Rhodanobacteraceae bacterium]|nr:flagellar export protein FliJ [Rhodanobacteraceae bacterium]
MNAPRSQRLQRVADIAGKHTDDAANVLAQRLRTLDAAKQQLQELEQFRSDYGQPATAPGQPGISVAELRNRQQFVARIDQAIIQQRLEVEQHTRFLALARAAWIESRSRSAALETVTERHRSREKAGEERAEQAALDERMQRRKTPWKSP